MSNFLGIDTSNYTTSAAIYDDITGQAISEKMLLPVKEGAIGLRQSDAVFHHTVQLPEVIEKLFRSLTEKFRLSVFPFLREVKRALICLASYRALRLPVL